MKSYLHCVDPTSDWDDACGFKTPLSTSPQNSPQVSPVKSPMEDSESSSEDSNSEDGGEEGHDGFAKHCRVCKFAYSSLGKMRLCESLDIDVSGNIYQDSWSTEPAQGNPKVLLIENHL